MTSYKIGSMSARSKYYIRRIIATLLIGSPCYIWSQVIVLLGFVGLAKISPDALVTIDESVGVHFFVLLVWVTMFVLGWIGSRYLIVKPKELQSMALKDQGKVGRDTPTMKESLTG